jgi:DNA modification methylase
VREIPEYDLLLTDPPYSTDVDDIEKFAASWLPSYLSKMKSTGRAYVFIGSYPRELKAYLDACDVQDVLVWTYRNTLGPTPKNRYKRNWQAVLYFEGEDAAPLDCIEMVEQFSVQDVSAPDGRQADRYHAWQKPLKLVERFIRHSTRPGDLVVDPFACTGSHLLAAASLGRRSMGCEINEDNMKIAIQRGCYE